MKDSIKVAGVTFANENGENRQEIIASLGLGFKTAKLKHTTFEGERAVEVRIGGKLIGYVPRTQLSNPLSYADELTALVSVYSGPSTDKYYVVLTERQTPSAKEYAYMKKCCLAAKRPMPAYDRRAYAQYWAVVKA